MKTRAKSLEQPVQAAPEFDPKQYPHYDLQSSIYSLLLSALTLSVHYEKYPGAEKRQKDLELLIKAYLETCKQIEIG